MCHLSARMLLPPCPNDKVLGLPGLEAPPLLFFVVSSCGNLRLPQTLQTVAFLTFPEDRDFGHILPISQECRNRLFCGAVWGVNRDTCSTGRAGRDGASIMHL